jgi:hypothetical protein
LLHTKLVDVPMWFLGSEEVIAVSSNREVVPQSDALVAVCHLSIVVDFGVVSLLLECLQIMASL